MDNISRLKENLRSQGQIDSDMAKLVKMNFDYQF